jgi:hypothetical protein
MLNYQFHDPAIERIAAVADDLHATMVYNPLRVPIGPGSLYAAPIGTTEPTSVTGAWPAGWVPLGYTEQGSVFESQTQAAAVEVEEEIFAIMQAITGKTGVFTFACAEYTQQNLVLALNGGIGTGVLSGITGVGSDSSIWVEPPDPGTEQRSMIGWDYLPQDATAPAIAGGLTFGRIILRRAINTGNVQLTHRKGNNKTVIANTFTLEKPAGVRPFRFWLPPQLAS